MHVALGTTWSNTYLHAQGIARMMIGTLVIHTYVA